MRSPSQLLVISSTVRLKASRVPALSPLTQKAPRFVQGARFFIVVSRTQPDLQAARVAFLVGTSGAGPQI